MTDELKAGPARGSFSTREGPAFGEDPLSEPEFWDYDEGPAERAAVARAPEAAVRAGTVSHRRNIATTAEFILHDGPKVRVAGKTTLIYDMERKPHHVSLQLTRLKRVTSVVPSWQILPAKLYLEGPEVEELYARLAEARLALPELADTNYMLIRTGANPDIEGLAALIDRVAEAPEQFLPLQTLVGPAQLQALRAVINIGRFAAARTQLAEMVEKNVDEHQLQKWFEDNDWVFGSEYVGRLDKPRRISPDSQIDLMFLAVDGFADIFELKRSGPDVFVRPGGRNFYQPSPDLNAAFGQAVHYLAEADSMGFFNEVRRDMPIYKPRVRLVLGRSRGWDDAMRRTYREVSAAWSRIELLTYDMVLQRIDLLIRTMSRELKAASGNAVEAAGATAVQGLGERAEQT
jgi:hypothetical protein